MARSGDKKETATAIGKRHLIMAVVTNRPT
jgi:hypothetical protein